MKFGRLLRSFQAENELPECILDYKRLKKKLKAFKQQQEQQERQKNAEAGPSTGPTTTVLDVSEAAKTQPSTLTEDEDERQFIAMLNEDVSRINDFFIEKEEDAVIKLKSLEDRVAAATESKELSALGSALIGFHGEMVLLLHWSLVNYAAVAKILKKHDKLTGSLLRAPYLSNVLHQPFLSTESISKLVRQAEELVKQLAAEDAEEKCEQQQEAASNDMTAGTSSPHPQPHLVKRTRAALGMLKELQESAITPSTLLPPCTTGRAMHPIKKKRVEEQQDLEGQQ